MVGTTSPVCDRDLLIPSWWGRSFQVKLSISLFLSSFTFNLLFLLKVLFWKTVVVFLLLLGLIDYCAL